MKPYAEFRGWQENLPGEPAFPIFNIRGDHERHDSTVCAGTLIELGIKVPPIPLPNVEWAVAVNVYENDGNKKAVLAIVSDLDSSK